MVKIMSESTQNLIGQAIKNMDAFFKKHGRGRGDAFCIQSVPVDIPQSTSLSWMGDSYGIQGVLFIKNAGFYSFLISGSHVNNPSLTLLGAGTATECCELVKGSRDVLKHVAQGVMDKIVERHVENNAKLARDAT